MSAPGPGRDALGWRRGMVLAGAAALTLVGARGATAGPPIETLRGFFATANTILTDPEMRGRPAQALAAIRRLADAVLDFPAAAERALGPEWQARTPAEREEFVRLFAHMIERAVVTRLASRARLTTGVTVRYVGESVDGDEATVPTRILGKAGGAFPVAFQMLRRGDRWKVADVVVDGVSLTANYRAQLARIIQRASYPGLVAMMRAKIPAEAAAPPAPATTVAGAAAGPESAPNASGQAAGPAPPAAPGGLPGGTAARRIPPAVIEARIAAAALGPAPRDGETRYWVQVGAFRNALAARQLAARLRERHFPVPDGSAGSVTGAAGGPPLVRVRVGPFRDRGDALVVLRELQAQGYRPFLGEDRN